MDYQKTKKHWEQDSITVHADVSDESIKKLSQIIIEYCQPNMNETILDIGCGDGLVDHYIKSHVRELHGFDFSEHLIKRAKENNPECQYWCQSFLEPVKNNILYDKAFSFSVFQYCKPTDIELILKSSVNCLKSGGFVTHLDVLDGSKMRFLYFRKKTIYKTFSGIISVILYKCFSLFNISVPVWKDGTYWHKMKKIVKECDKLGFKTEISDALCKYRSHLKIYKNK